MEDDIGMLHHEDDMPKSATISVVDIEGKKFVSGLFWQPLIKPRAYKKEAQEIGKREGMDIVAIRRSTIMQAGFAPKGQGAMKGMYSLAATLAGKLGNSWIGVFALGDDRYAFVAVDDGAIVPGCDVIGDREDIEQRLRYYYAQSPWEHVYVPQDFDFGGEAANISELLAEKNFTTGEWREFRLLPLKFGLTSRELINYGVVATVLIAAVWGGTLYREEQQRKEREAMIRAEQIRQAELERIKANTKKEKEIKGLDHPWVKMPSVEDFLKGCVGTINDFPLSLGGWVFEFAVCDGSTASASYKRQDSATSNDLIVDAKTRFDSEPIFAEDFESAVVGKPLNILLGGDDVLGLSGEVLPAASSVFQEMGIRMRFLEKVVQKPATLPGQPEQEEQEAPPDWKEYTFMFDSELAPTALFAGHAWNGMRLNKIGVKLAPETAKLTWTIAGEQYAK